jgi:hypothetical protein
MDIRYGYGAIKPLIASASLSRLIALKQLIGPSSCSFKQVCEVFNVLFVLPYAFTPFLNGFDGFYAIHL